MGTGQPELIEFIRATIRAQGPVSFAWFMEQALYHPVHGYYSSGRAKIGRRGDYFTNVSVGPLFGRLLAKQFTEMWNALDRPNEFKIVEQGAYDGTLAQDVLQATREFHPDLFDALRYEIIEPFPVWRECQQERLRGLNVEWCSSLEEIQAFVGIHFSNELLDSFPVHLVVWNGERWRELKVTEDLQLEPHEIIDGDLRAALAKFPMHLPNECKTEVNLAALHWLGTLSEKLQRGFVLVIDYGYTERATETLRVYAQHRALAWPFLEIGNADITAHVDWKNLRQRAEDRGLTTAGFADQHHFLTGLLGDEVETFDVKTRRALQTLLHPEMLGRKFQFLVLQKDLPRTAQLSGLRFSTR